MSQYDILMLAVMAGSVLFGLWKGFAWQIASLAAIFVSYFVALNFRGALSPYISASEPWNQFAAMLILYVGTSLVIWMAYGYMQKTILRLRLKGFDTQAGALLGALKGALLCMLVTLFAVTLFGENVRETVINSRSGSYIAAGINRLNAMVPSEIHAVLDQHVQTFNRHLSEQDAGFLQRGVDQLDEKIQTIRGKLQLPNSSLKNVTSGPTASKEGGFAERDTRIDSAPLNEITRSLGDEAWEAAREAGRRFWEQRTDR